LTLLAVTSCSTVTSELALFVCRRVCQNPRVSASGQFTPKGAARSLVYRLLWTCADGLQKAANACLYLAAGLLRQEDLRAASRVQWSAYGTSVDHVDAGLDRWEHQLYTTLFRPADRVLLVGCGAGRELLALRELGYDVTGLDQAPELVRQAQAHLARRGLAAMTIAGFAEDAHLEGQFDAVVFSSCCYSLMPRAAGRIATLARMKEHLRDNGRMLITYAGYTRQSPLSRTLTAVSAAVAGTDWRPEPGDSFARDHLARRVLRYEHLFHPGEVARECAAAGLRVVRDEARSAFFCAVAVRC
jgi:SAM-dependent methyltransferase